MTTFWIICALLLVVASLFIVLPLWRSTTKKTAVQRDAANLEIFRDQIAEMDADLRNALLTPELYEQGKRELQARMLDEVKNPGEESANVAVRNPHRALALVLLVCFPLVAVGMYWKMGNFDAFQPQDNVAKINAAGAPHSDAVLKELEEKLATNPDDAQGWALLGRSYAQMERFVEAARAYENLTRLIPNEAQLWAEYAFVLAKSKQRLDGLPTTLLGKALEIDPNNLNALALSGSAAMDRGDYAVAISFWEKVLKLLPKDSDDARMVENDIAQAREMAGESKGEKPFLQAQQPAPGGAQSASAGKEQITGTVTLSDAMKGKASPDDTLFVLARASEGPKMPLAIMRKQVKDLPLKFTLDDSMAMAPQMKLSNFDKVVVIARISKSGNAMTQPGDLQGMSAVIKPGTTGMNLSIDKMAQ